MKILFLTNYFAPERAASSYLGENLREAYAKEGFEMTLYAPMPTRGVSDEVRAEYANRTYEEFFDGKLKVHRFHLMKESKNPIQRAIRYFLSINKQYKNGLREKDVDVLSISSTPPFNLLLIRKLKKKKVTFYVGKKKYLVSKCKYKGDIIFPSEIKKDGEKFVAWCTDKDLKLVFLQAQLNKNKNLKLYAKFEKIENVIENNNETLFAS